ncbi:DUF6702 family protein [Formosa haliotis]|uniref:DUF6702 family protein n=1 Tax=Formosa haliotis TaxID=1555194 RepID=UPI000824760E|nr:DUF6702 family protein [Formosa haliotis]
MKALKYLLVLVLIPVFAFTVVHKYYVSITEVQYVKEEKSVQIISRIFIDDLENVLRQRYDKTLTLAGENESEKVDVYLAKYLKEKIHIKINGKPATLHVLGKTYDLDVAVCYIEIPNVENISEFEIKNQVLYDLFEEQQNVVRLDINDKKKSFILITQNNKGLLKFD